jgi:hypothetical protein
MEEEEWNCEGCEKVFDDSDLLAYCDMWLCTSCLADAGDAESMRDDEAAMCRLHGL